MNILLIHNYYQERGGEDFVFENEASALEKAGHKVTRYTRHNEELKKSSTADKLRFFINTVYNKKTVEDIKQLIKKSKIDVAHVHNVFPLISPSVYLILSKMNIKIVQTLHNYRFLCPNGQFFRNNKNCTLCSKGKFFYCALFRCYKRSFIFSFLYAFTIRKNKNVFKKCINKYIALNGFMKKIMIEAGYDEKKIVIKDNAFKDSKNIKVKSGNYFLFLGRLSGEKGIGFLLDVFTELDKYNIVVAGTGAELEMLKAKYKSGRIKFTGFVSGKDKEKLLREALSLVVPSVWFENYPMSIVESFSYGVPVIASKIGGLPFIITDKYDGLLFNTNDKEDLKEKLGVIYEDKRFRKNLSQNAYKTFKNRMSLTTNIKLLEDIYTAAINEK